MDQNNLECLKIIAKNFLKDEPELKDRDQWQQLLRHLNAHKIIPIDDLKAIDPCFLIFPIKFSHFIRIITETFNDQQTREIQNQLISLIDQINDSKSIINFWNSEGLSHKDLKCLIIIYEKLKQELYELTEEFQELNENIQTTKENVQAIKDDFEPEAEYQPTSCDYQKTDRFSIEKEYQNIRIRNVQYRNQKIIVLKTFANGIVKQIGYDIDLDFPVEVVKIPKLFSDFEISEIYLNTFDSHKELTFSKYFPNFLGFNNIADPNYNLYFFETIKGKSLKKLLQTANYRLKVDIPLYRLWIREIFLGLQDLLKKSTYMPILPIKLKNIYVAESGLKIYLKNIQFSSIRKLKSMSAEVLEALLLENFANLILEILGSSKDNLEEFDENNLEFKNFVISLLYAKKDMDQYIKGQVDKRIQFHQLLNHHILSEKFIIETDVVDIVDDYEAIFNDYY